MVLGVVGAGRRAHREWGADAGTHEVGTGKRLAPLSSGEGEGRGRIVGGSDRGVGGIGDTATFRIWASGRRSLARFRALEVRRWLTGVLTLVSWRIQRERCNIGCRGAMAVSSRSIAGGITGRGTAQTAHEAAGARGGVWGLVWRVGRRGVRETRAGRHHGRRGDAASSALLAPAWVAFGRGCRGTGDGAVADTASRLISVVGVLLLMAEFLFLIQISIMYAVLAQVILLPPLEASSAPWSRPVSFSSGRR